MKKLVYNFAVIASLSVAATATAQDWQSLGNDISSKAEATVFTLASNGTIYVANQNPTSGGLLNVRKYDGKKWTNVGKENFSNGPASSLSIAVDASNTPYVAFKDQKAGDKPFVQKFDGKGWVNVAANGPAEGYGDNMSLCFDKNNVLYIALNDQKKGRISVMKLEGGEWKEVGVPSEGSGRYISLKFDRNNTPYIAFADENEAKRATLKKFDGSNWVQVGASTPSVKSADYITFDFDSNNVPYIGYQDSWDDGKIIVKKLDKNEWSAIGGPVFKSDDDNVVMALDKNNVPYVAYHNTNSHKLIAKKFDGTAWVPAAKSEEASGYSTRISIVSDKANNVLYLGYNDSDNGNKTGIKKLEIK
jgi:hypothetical protein